MADASVAQRSLVALLRVLRSADLIADGAEECPRAVCRVLSYRRDFAYAWGVTGQDGPTLIDWVMADAPVGCERTVVLVVEAVPREKTSTIDVARFVGPAAWALTVSRDVLDRLSAPASPRPPALRVLIVDLRRPDQIGSLGLEAGLGVTMPWVQGYGVLERPDLGSRLTGATPLPLCRRALAWRAFGAASAALLADLMEVDRVTSLAQALDESQRDGEPDRYARLLEAACTVWAATLGSPAHRHHVGNLVAPLLLAEGLGQPDLVGTSPPLEALRRLLRAVGVLPRPEGPESPTPAAAAPMGEPPSPPVELGSAPPATAAGAREPAGLLVAEPEPVRVFPSGPSGPPRLLLVDDQFALGYHRVLASVLFGPASTGVQIDETDGAVWRAQGSQGTLKCQASPDDLLKHVPESADMDWSTPRWFARCDALLLDLRLYATPEERRIFFDRLLSRRQQACEKLGQSDPHVARAYDAAWKLAGGQPGDEPTALALLPLLLSHFDPSLPIVLFSSSEQRRVLVHLLHRPAIIVDFSKPAPADPRAWRTPAESVTDLRGALAKALRLAEARFVWRRIVELTGLRTAGKERFPQLQPMKQVLAGLYQRYILTERYFDFIGIPYELIEYYAGGIEQVFPNQPAKGTAHALRLLRHRKAHGYETQAGALAEADFRETALVAFLAFVDLLGNRKAVPAGRKDLWKEIESLIKDRVSTVEEAGDRLRAFINAENLTWNEFAAWALSGAVHWRVLSQALETAVVEFAKRHIRGLTDALSETGRAQAPARAGSDRPRQQASVGTTQGGGASR